MAQPHYAAVELPNQGMAPTHDIIERRNSQDDISVKSGAGRSNVQVHGADETMHEEEMPEGPTTTRWEEWAYYMYYNGNNGVGPMGYAATLFQGLANGAGFDPASPTHGPCSESTTNCSIKWGGTVRSVDSVVLIANGIVFAIMTVLFTTIGSVADYGNANRYILMFFSVLCWAAQYGFIGLWKPEQWQIAMAFFMVGYVCYGLTLVFYASVFPRLARNTAKVKTARRQLDNGEIDSNEYEIVEMLERNRLSNISTAHSNWGYLAVMLLALALLLPQPIASNPKVNNYVIALTNSYWVLVGLPWFFIQKNRPGPKLPKGEHWLTIGWKQIWHALMQYRRLPYTFIYLFAFFLLADGLNTTGTMVGIVQNQHIQFSFLASTYLGITQACTSIFSCYAYWYLQKYLRVRTKRMFQITNVITVIIPFWGMLGLWTNKIGFHNTWEFYAYNASFRFRIQDLVADRQVVFGLGQAPYYAYSQTLMSDLTPPGFEGMFFGLFGITNRASSLIGPNVCAAIIDASGNSWHPFIFLFIICTMAALVIWIFVDVEKGRADAIAFSIEQRGLNNEIRAEQATTVPVVRH